MEKAIRTIMNVSSVSDNAIRVLCDVCATVVFRKRDLLIEEGKKTGVAYFIAKGMTRSYWLVDGEEVTTSFSPVGGIVFSMDEMYFGMASSEYVEALEPIEAYRISIADLRRLISTDIDLAVWWGRIHELEYRRIHQSHKERLTLSARDRYEAFRRQFPDLCLRVPRKYIASYLGMDLATLSRLKN